jgi:hypothetical protein
MQNKLFRFGPLALSTTLTTNLLNPPTASGGVNAGASPQFILLKHLRVVNKTASPATFSLWLGATGANAAGTEVIAQNTVVAAGQSFDWYGQLRIDAADFLVGGSNTATALTIQGEGEIGVAG